MSPSTKSPSFPRRKRKIAGVPVAIVEAGARRDNYIARADQVTESDWKLLKFLYDVRVTTRDRLRETKDPFAFHSDALPTAIRPKASAAEIKERQLRAKRLVDMAVTRLREPSLEPPLGALGFIEVTAQRAEETSDKARALCRSGASSVKGRLPELITLSKEGLFYVKGRLGLDDDARPAYRAFQRAHSRLAHQLTSSDILLALKTYEQAGVLEIVGFANEYAWVAEMTDGTPATYGQRILVTDVVITCRPKGQDDGSLDEMYLVEVDCGSQRYGKPVKGQDPATSLPWKIHNYYVLAKKLSKRKPGGARRGEVSFPLQLVFVVPSYGRIKPLTRAARHLELFNSERRDQAARGGKEHELVTLLSADPLDEPTPENFALFVAEHLEITRRRKLERKGSDDGSSRERAIPKETKITPSSALISSEATDGEWVDVVAPEETK